jgi:hypothetical protein
MRFALEKAIGIVVGVMAFEFASRAVLHLSVAAALFDRVIR